MAATMSKRVIRANRRDAIGDQHLTAKLAPYNRQSRSRFLTGHRPRGINLASGYPLEGRRFLRSKSQDVFILSVEDRAARVEPAVQLRRSGRPNEGNAMRTYVLGAALLFTLTAPALAEEF